MQQISTVLHATISGISPPDVQFWRDLKMLASYTALKSAFADEISGKLSQFGRIKHAFKVRP